MLTWDPNIEPDLAGYRIYYGTASGGSYNGTSTVAGMNSPIDVGNVTSSTVTGLGFGTYFFAVTAKDSSGHESGYSNEVQKLFVDPRISAITVSSKTSSSAVITWVTNETATSQVEYGLSNSYGSSTTLDTTLSASHGQTLSGLTPLTTYHFRVKSADASNSLATSGDNVFVTTDLQQTASLEITAIIASNITGSPAVITWSTNEAATSQVQYGATTAYGSSTTPDSTLVTNHSVTLNGLSGFITYHFQVLSQDAAGNPATSGDNTFTTSTLLDTTPPVISSITAGDITDSGAVITWSTDEAATTQVEYGTTTAYGSTSVRNLTLFTSHVQTLTGLLPNTTYHYQVKSVDPSNNLSTSGDNIFVTADDSQPQGKASSRAAMSGGCGMVRPSDGKPSGPGQAADMQALLALILIVLTRREILRVAARAQFTTASMPLFLIGIMILSVSGCGSHHSSGSGPAITTESSIGTGPGKAVLNWDKPTTNADRSVLTDLAGFKLYYGTTTPITPDNSNAIDVAGTTFYTLTGFELGTYYFAVTAYDEDGYESTFSNEESKVIAGT